MHFVPNSLPFFIEIIMSVCVLFLLKYIGHPLDLPSSESPPPFFPHWYIMYLYTTIWDGEGQLGRSNIMSYWSYITLIYKEAFTTTWFTNKLWHVEKGKREVRNILLAYECQKTANFKACSFWDTCCPFFISSSALFQELSKCPKSR